MPLSEWCFISALQWQLEFGFCCKYVWSTSLRLPTRPFGLSSLVTLLCLVGGMQPLLLPPHCNTLFSHFMKVCLLCVQWEDRILETGMWAGRGLAQLQCGSHPLLHQQSIQVTFLLLLLPSSRQSGWSENLHLKRCSLSSWPDWTHWCCRPSWLGPVEWLLD